MNFVAILGRAVDFVRRRAVLAAVVLCSALLLTSLFLRAGAVAHEVHHEYTLELRGLREADAAVDAEMLANRLELSKNYDALSRHLQRALDIGRRALSVPDFLADEDRTAVIGALRDMQTLLDEKARLVDLFKRDDAVLRNSLAYFPGAVNAYFASAHDPVVGQAVGRYARHLLAYAREPDAARLAILSESMKQLSGMSIGARDRATVENLLRHGAIVATKTASVDKVSQDILRMDSLRQLDHLSRLYADGYDRAENAAERYRVLLYVLALVLTAFLALTVIRFERTRRSLANANQELRERYTAQLLAEDRLRL
ncbi:MAG TPA: DAHL domain-containing protein, partial [Rhodocyclaceae bacterium]|nr:DAHL domain-containing protein [Rhodocyclaceae bacterium]